MSVMISSTQYMNPSQQELLKTHDMLNHLDGWHAYLRSRPLARCFSALQIYKSSVRCGNGIGENFDKSVVVSAYVFIMVHKELNLSQKLWRIVQTIMSKAV